MHLRLTGILVAAAAVCAGAVFVHAAVPTFWQVSTESEFLKGEVENLSVDGYGRLTLGPTATSVYESNAPFLWAMAAAPDGSVFVGSGNEGQVYRIDPAGKGSVFLDTEELEVHALALAPGGGLYVGTSPDGRIYKTDAKGKSTVLFDPPDKYIWSLAVDKAGNVFAATGDKGVVYKVSPDGTGVPFYDTKATHAISLAFDREGRLLVGTESPGRVFQIDASGKPFVLLDSNYNEIHTLRVDGSGTIYAAAVGARSGVSDDRPPARMNPEPTPPPVIPTVSTEITAIAVVDVSQSSGVSATTRSTQDSSAGAIYRIAADGAADVIWQSREDSPYDVLFEADGTLLVTTGSKGKIYRLAGDPLQPTLLTRATAQQVTNVARIGSSRLLFTTSNPGKVFQLSPTRSDRGTYTSDVRDAQTVAAWGTIRWQAALPSGSRLEISTRSGNTRTPDETWSAWSTVYANPEGSGITSPRARYLQWRAVLIAGSSEPPVLTSVTAAYLQRNLRPRVATITIHPPGTVFQRPFPSGDPEIAGFEGDLPERRLSTQSPGASANSPNLGRRTYQKGLMTFVWRAEDDNRDELTYDVLYRREGETAWKMLKQALNDPIIVWDTTSVPNGRYIVRVVASDAPSNPPSSALSGSMESAAFEVDNTPPTITINSVRRVGGRLMIAFEARDEYSAVQKADYSLDGDRWHPIYPKDGIADSRIEQFELVLEGDAAARGVIVRAFDALNNVTSARGDAAAASNGR